MRLDVPIGPGELIENSTILELKAQLSSEEKLGERGAELTVLVVRATPLIDGGRC